VVILVEKEKDNNKPIFWAFSLIPLILINLSPYLGISLPETIDNEETYNKLLFGFSITFVVVLFALFSSIKCLLNSEEIIAKVAAFLLLLLNLMLICGMTYVFLTGYANQVT